MRHRTNIQLTHTMSKVFLHYVSVNPFWWNISHCFVAEITFFSLYHITKLNSFGCCSANSCRSVPMVDLHYIYNESIMVLILL